MFLFCPLFVLLASSILPFAFGCLCKVETPEHNFCAADWVAHVLIAKMQDGVRMPGAIVDRQNENNSRYEVKYLQMFKISGRMKLTDKNQVVLPINVYTASEDAACGILLDVGHEYLLAGQYVNGTMMTRLCGQILLEDLKEARKHNILEWAEVPEKIKGQLVKQELDVACKKEEKEEEAEQGIGAPNNGTGNGGKQQRKSTK